MIDKQKLISELKKQTESNDNHINQLQKECGGNCVLLQSEYGSLIATLNGRSVICAALIKRIESGFYDNKEDE